jgi:hypothetical protein
MPIPQRFRQEETTVYGGSFLRSKDTLDTTEDADTPKEDQYAEGIGGRTHMYVLLIATHSKRSLAQR